MLRGWAGVMPRQDRLSLVKRKAEFARQTRPFLFAFVLASALYAQNSSSGARTSFTTAQLISDARELVAKGNRMALTKAAAKSRQAIVEASSTFDRSNLALAENELGICLDRLGQAKEALEAYSAALSIWTELDDQFNEATALSNIGVLYEAKGDYQKALDYLLNRALPIRRRVGDISGELYTMTSLGTVYTDLGDYQTAQRYYREVLDRSKAQGIQELTGAAQANLGFVAFLGRDDKTATEYLNNALIILRKLDFLRAQPYALNTLAKVYAAEDKNGDATRQFTTALQAARATGDKKIEVVVLNNMAQVQINTGASFRAIPLILEALILARSADGREIEGRCLATLMLAYKAQRKFELAAFYGKQAININQELRMSTSGLDRSTQRLFLLSKEDQYRSLADLLIQRGRLAEAEQVLRLLKEEEFSDYLRSSEVAPTVDHAAMTAREEEWHRQYEEIASRVTAIGVEYDTLAAKPSRNAEEETRYQRAFDGVTVANREFQSTLGKIAKEDTSIEAGTERIRKIEDSETLKGTLAAFGGRAAILYTIVLPDKYRVIVITPAVQVAREFPVKAIDLNRKVAAFRLALADPSTNPKPIAMELYRILVKPVESDLKGARVTTIMWSLDGVLRYLPMSALFDGEHYLVQKYANVVFTPASRDSLKDPPSITWDALGFGVSQSAPGFYALPNVPAELRAIIHDKEDAAPGGVLSGRVFLNADFTEARLVKELQGKYQVLHIASHFRFDPGNQDNSFLLLGNAEKLTVADVKVLPYLFRDVDLLTLSACSTAVGALGADGREVEGFGVLVQRAGARAVLATLWDVADVSTAIFMARFYQGRVGPPVTSKAEALQQTQIAFIEQSARSPSGKTFEHPFYWAPFILTGNWL